MPGITIYGVAFSNFVRTARLTCEEKGVDHALEEIGSHSNEILALHPHGYVPAMRHGDFVLYETGAIAGYVDEAFEGPALQPVDLRDRARMRQWISAICHYYDRTMIREIVIQRLLVPMRGGTPDEEMIAAALPKMERQLAILDSHLAENEFLAGSALSLADLFMLPIAFYLSRTDEGAQAMEGRDNISRWYEAMAARPSFAATQPPPPKADADR